MICDNARVYHLAYVCGYARVSGEAVATKNVINVIGLRYDITLTDDHIQIGCKQFTFKKALALNKRWTNTLENYEEAKQIEDARKIIVELIKTRMEK